MMPRKSLIKVIFSIIFVLALVITTVTISPRVASAENTSNSAIGALEAGIEFYEQGDLVNAESSYQEAIELEETGVEVFISTKQHLAKIKESQGNLEQANQLRTEADSAIKSLGIRPRDKACIECNLCTLGCGEIKNVLGNPNFKYCNPCDPRLCGLSN